MNVDHVFIFSNKGREADDLVEFGLIEGSGRVHPGLGTANRRFFFDNFYLEILWVENEAEAKSEYASPLKLWERSTFNDNDYSRYGLCFENEIDSDPLFKNSLKFQPEYYPKGKFLEVFPHKDEPYFPWIFRLPISSVKKHLNEPTQHDSLGIKKLTKVIFGLKTTELESGIIVKIQNNSDVEFNIAKENSLILTFDDGEQKKYMKFEKLNLEIHY